MRINRIAIIGAILVTAFSLLALLTWTAVSAQEETATADLERISEETGFVAVTTPLSPDCIFDDDYQVYLCEPPRRPTLLVADLAARAQALALLNSSGVLFIPDSTNKRIMVFDPVSGDLVDPNFIILDDDATGTVVHAIMSPVGTVFVSDQTRDVVHEYALDGTYLGIFAPAGGANTAILDNIRGMALRPNGNLLVTVGAGTNANAIAEFDAAGNHVGNFVANGSGGLNSPYDVYERPPNDWLVSSINTNQVLRYGWADGSSIGPFAAISSFPQQILQIGNGNVLVSNFSGTPGVHEFTAAGTLVGVYNPTEVSDYRGVYELPNDHLLASTSGGVYEIDRDGNLIEIKHTGQSRFIEYVVLQPILFNKTAGLDSSTCANTAMISVAPDTPVTYCFEITNNTSITRTLHDLEDSHLGTILDGFSLSLSPGDSIFLTQTALITQTIVNTATWTAYNPGLADVISATATAEVTVVPPAIALTKTVGTDPSACAETNEIDVAEGTAVTYCFEVTNSGLTPFALHDLEDSHLGTILDGFSLNLVPGATIFLTQTAVITQTMVNTATWTAYNPGPADVVMASDSATVNILPAAISLTKTVGTDPSVCAEGETITAETGAAVTYCFEVTNTGLATLTLHDLEDSHLGTILDGFSLSLAPGATIFLTQTAIITQTTVNTATWTAYNPGPYSVVMASNSATVHVPDPAISLTVTVGLDPAVCAATSSITVTPGSVVAYCYTVTNTGNVTLEEHTITDSVFGLVDSFTVSLEPGMSVSVIYTQTIMTDAVSTVTWLAESELYSVSNSDIVSVLVQQEEEEEFRLYLPIIMKP